MKSMNKSQPIISKEAHTSIPSNSKTLTNNGQVKDYDLAARGTCPHCDNNLSSEQRGRGTGVIRLCKT
jgi:hypothetical protein